MLANKHPFTSFPAAKHPKHNKLAVTDIRKKKQVDFLYYIAWVSTFAPAIILLTWVPLQKFPFLFNL